MYRKKVMPYALFFIWPFMSLVLACVNYSKRYTSNILWGFFIFYGMTILIPDFASDHDLVRYQMAFERGISRKNLPFIEAFMIPYGKGIYSAGDFYLNFMNLVVARISNNFRVFLMVIALVLGFFCSRNLTIAFKYLNTNKKTVFTFILFFTCLMIYPFWSIAGYRFVTAANIFIYGVLHLELYKKNRYFIFILVSPLVHFTFYFALLVYILYKIIGNRFTIYLTFLLVSLFASNINPQTLHGNSELAPVFMQNKIRGYTSERNVKSVRLQESRANWYVKGHTQALLFGTLYLVVLLWWKRKKMRKSATYYNLLCFGLLLLAISTLLSPIPSMFRFSLAAIFIIMVSLMLINFKTKLFNSYSSALALLLFLGFIIVRVRIGFDETGLNTLFLNPFISSFFPDSPPLIDFVK